MTDSSRDNVLAPEPSHQPTQQDSGTGTGGSGESPERGMPDLNQRHRRGGRWVTPLLIAVVAVVGTVWTVHGLIARHDASAKARRDSAAEQPAQGRRFGDAPPTSAPVASTVTSTPPAMPASAPIAVVPAPAAPRASSTPVRTYYDAPLMALAQSDGGATMSMPSSSVSVAPMRPADTSGATAQTQSPLAQALVPIATPRARATWLGNRNFILAQGAKIDCAGDTAFDSTEAGISTCTVTKNVYSDNGHVVLIERGSQVNSEYRANVAQGQRRVFILSARVKTPNGVTVAIDSPAADALGRMGVGGYVNNHWGERVGAAVLLGLVQDSIGYLATRGGNANGSIEFENTEQTGNDMATRVLDSTINVAPTLKQNQGAEFTIVVARDLDFRSVYALQPE